MTYQIIHSSGLCAENQVNPSMVQRALKWWREESGMKGTYEAKPEPRIEKQQITLARRPKYIWRYEKRLYFCSRKRTS